MQTKTAVAATAAGAAILLAAFIGFRSIGLGRDIRTPRDAMGSPGGGPRGDTEGEPTDWTPSGWNQAGPHRPGPNQAGPPPDPIHETRDYDFPRTSDAQTAGDAIDAQLDAFVDDASASGEPAPAGGWRSVLDSWRAFIAPVVRGDRDTFVDVVGRMGGLNVAEAGQANPAETLYAKLAEVLEGSPVDLSNAFVRAPGAEAVPRRMVLPPGVSLPPGAIPTMAHVTETTDESGATSVTRTVSLPLASVFPGAAAAVDAGGRMIEVWAPAKLSGRRGNDPDVGLSVVLVRDPARAAWVPAGVRMTLATDAAAKRMGMGG